MTSSELTNFRGGGYHVRKRFTQIIFEIAINLKGCITIISITVEEISTMATVQEVMKAMNSLNIK